MLPRHTAIVHFKNVYAAQKAVEEMNGITFHEKVRNGLYIGTSHLALCARAVFGFCALRTVLHTGRGVHVRSCTSGIMADAKMFMYEIWRQKYDYAVPWQDWWQTRAS